MFILDIKLPWLNPLVSWDHWVWSIITCNLPKLRETNLFNIIYHSSMNIMEFKHATKFEKNKCQAHTVHEKTKR